MKNYEEALSEGRKFFDSITSMLGEISRPREFFAEGWADGYRTAMMEIEKKFAETIRAFEHCRDPK